MQSIFRFLPIYKERPWGGQRIAVFDRELELGKRIGESWEISDLPGAESTLSEGPWKGKSIRWLLAEHGPEIMGETWDRTKRFPLLVKILDARERLSLQVHPPLDWCRLHGESSKTELWYLLGAETDAGLIAGFKRGVSRIQFENLLERVRGGEPAGSLDKEWKAVLHRIRVKTGDAMLVPAGRIHAIDAGCLILEIQSSSDTTFRAYDWGRVGLDGKPRPLHLEETLAATQLEDVEPVCAHRPAGVPSVELGSCEHFKVRLQRLDQPMEFHSSRASLLSVVTGSIRIGGVFDEDQQARWGDTLLLGCHPFRLEPLERPTEVLFTTDF